MTGGQAPQAKPPAEQDRRANPAQGQRVDPSLDLQECPRCWLRIERIVWGRTNCPGCGLHFECC